MCYKQEALVNVVHEHQYIMIFIKDVAMDKATKALSLYIYT
jgi:hypothetical protein